MTDPLDDNEQRRKSLLNSLGPEPGPTMTVPGAGDTGGVAGPLGDAGGFAPLPTPEAAPAPFARNNTRLMEGDAGKLADVGHAAKSPKYDFLQLANQGKYGYDQLGDMLGELQKGPNAQHWQGWTADKDKLRFGGDPSQLGSAWNGVTEVDAIGGFNSGNPQGFRWGAEMPGGAPEGAAAQQGGGMGGQFAPTVNGPLDQQLGSNPLEAIQAALAKYGQGNRPNMDALLAQLGG
mgnify:CR=1 FL=1